MRDASRYAQPFRNWWMGSLSHIHTALESSPSGAQQPDRPMVRSRRTLALMTGGGLGDRFGKWDDRSVIYRADDPEQKVKWGRWAVADVIGSVIAVVLIAVCSALFGELVGGAVAFGIGVVYLVVYLTWRRRRNKRLTGSPTRWPSS